MSPRLRRTGKSRPWPLYQLLAGVGTTQPDGPHGRPSVGGAVPLSAPLARNGSPEEPCAAGSHPDRRLTGIPRAFVLEQLARVSQAPQAVKNTSTFASSPYRSSTCLTAVGPGTLLLGRLFFGG